MISKSKNYRDRRDFEQLLLKDGLPAALLPAPLAANATIAQKRERTAKLRKMLDSRIAAKNWKEARPSPQRSQPTAAQIEQRRRMNVWEAQAKASKSAYDEWVSARSSPDEAMPDSVMKLVSYDLYSARAKSQGRIPEPQHTLDPIHEEYLARKQRREDHYARVAKNAARPPKTDADRHAEYLVRVARRALEVNQALQEETP
jgi:hypothetical protein